MSLKFVVPDNIANNAFVRRAIVVIEPDTDLLPEGKSRRGNVRRHGEVRLGAKGVLQGSHSAQHENQNLRDYDQCDQETTPEW